MRDLESANAAAIHSDDRNQPPEPKRRKPRQRISYAERCQEHERAQAVAQVKLGMALTLLKNVECTDATKPVMTAVTDLLKEMVD